MAELGSRERLLNLGRRCEGPTAGLQVPGSELRGRRGAGLRASGEQGGGGLRVLSQHILGSDCSNSLEVNPSQAIS